MKIAIQSIMKQQEQIFIAAQFDGKIKYDNHSMNALIDVINERRLAANKYLDFNSSEKMKEECWAIINYHNNKIKQILGI
jgi:hypothetical protein